ncbi:MAG TPA: hypothetical protein VNO69_01170 [Methyloceanibacter sp.]|nr:hypothetical protein [Methyloceanibacter sp.]
MAKPRRSRPTPNPPPLVDTHFRIPGWAKLFFLASGWIIALLVGLLDLPAKINSFFDEAPKAATRIDDWLFVDRVLSGEWSSAPEGDVLAKPTDSRLDALEGGPVDVEMRVYRGGVEGSISSDGLGKHYIFSQIQIEGHVNGGIVKGIAWDAIGGEKVALAEFQLQPGERGGEPVLMFRVVKQGGKFFPERAILWRTEAIRPGELNMQFFRAIIKQQKERQKEWLKKHARPPRDKGE